MSEDGAIATSRLRSLAQALRPLQWTKNVAVLAPVVFAHRLTEPGTALRSIAAAVAFCFVSSAVYLLNDLTDRERDRLHPVKRLRPIASGALGATEAVGLSLATGAAGLSIFLVLGTRPFAVAVGYLALQAAYNLLLRRLVIVDVFAIALGFVLRVVAGAVAVSVPISNWLYVCTFLLALFLGFSKRRHELTVMAAGAAGHREGLVELSMPLLDQMIAAVTASTIVCYALYTMSDETVRKFGSDGLKFTIPFVMYGIFRYLFLIYRRGEGGSPERLLLTDAPLRVDIVLFCAVVFAVVYGAPFPG